jgi:predicted RNase H-like HicB family nuclease
MTLERTIKAAIRHGDQSGYVAECLEIPVVTQGQTLDEVTRNLREAVELHLERKDLVEVGKCERESVLATLEILADRRLTARLHKRAKRIDADVQAGKLHTMEEVFGQVGAVREPSLSKLRSIGWSVIHEYSTKTKNSFSLAPLGERGDRKAEGAPRFAGRGGERVSTNLESLRRSRKSKAKRKSKDHYPPIS